MAQPLGKMASLHIKFMCLVCYEAILTDTLSIYCGPPSISHFLQQCFVHTPYPRSLITLNPQTGTILASSLQEQIVNKFPFLKHVGFSCFGIPHA